MLQLIFALLLAAITAGVVSLQKTYSAVPIKELKRRAAGGDEVARLLYRVANYGVSLNVLLWIVLGASAGGFFVTLSRTVPAALALIGSTALLWVSFAWLPNSRVTALSESVAKTLAPILDWVLSRLHPLLQKITDFFKNQGRVSVHTGLYQKEDLLELLSKQNTQLDNRITSEELSLAQHALVFNDVVVRDVMTPRRVVRMVNVKDAVGPVMLDELHKSGFSRFPVYQDKQDNIVGTLYLRNLVDKQTTGIVKERMSKRVYYVNEDQSLVHVLNAFIKTKHHLFVVVNGFEELTGIITIEDVLEQLVGKNIVDEFDKYDDLRQVARLAANKDAKNHSKPAD